MRVHMYVPLHYDRTASRCGSFEPAADGYWTRPPFAHAYWVAPYWERGRYSEEIHEEFRRAGFYRCLQPRRYGGYEFDVGTFYAVVREISCGCPSTR